MPNKETYLIFFLTISTMLTLMQVFVYFWLKTVLRHDFPIKSKKWMPRIRWIFILMNIPIAFLFFRRQINLELSTLSKILFFPFTIWQAVIIVWTLILIPISVYYVLKKAIRNSIRLFRVEQKA